MDLKSFSCVLIGEGPLLLSCADVLLNKGHRVVGLVCGEPVVRRYGSSHGITMAEPGSDWTKILGGVDYLFSIVHLEMIPARVLDMPRLGAINFHDSLLPQYAGLNATSWALMDGVEEHGVTWHLMTAQPDAGDILKQRSIRVDSEETAFSLNRKCVEAGLESFKELVEELAEGRMIRRPQVTEGRKYCGKFKRLTQAGVLDWKRSAGELDAMVRALEFGPTRNPLGLPKVRIGGRYYVVGELKVLSKASGDRPGTVVSCDAESLTIATCTEDVRVSKPRTMEGERVELRELAERFGMRAGMPLGALSEEEGERLTRLQEGVVRHEGFWVERLAKARPIELEGSGTSGEAAGEIKRRVPVGAGGVRDGDEAMERTDVLLAGLAASLWRGMEDDRFDFGLSEEGLRRKTAGLTDLFSAVLPFCCGCKSDQSFLELCRVMRGERRALDRSGTFLRDLTLRYPELRPDGEGQSGWGPEKGTRAHKDPNGWPVLVYVGEGEFERDETERAQVRIWLRERSGEVWVRYDSQGVSEKAVEQMVDRWMTLVERAVAEPFRTCDELRQLGEADGNRLAEWNRTQVELSGTRRIEEQFEERAMLHPDRVALVVRREELTYAELNDRANQVAHYLRRRGVGPNVLVGICLRRSIDLVVALLGILKAGGAYVPLDPDYPRDRLEFMLQDSEARALITQRADLPQIQTEGLSVVYLDEQSTAIAAESRENPGCDGGPENLAYVIYTSGSTGKPKGVMIEHGNVTNFFAGMDRAIGWEKEGTWLAVTSISFDISVLELFWTLSRGYKVVLQTERGSLNGTFRQRRKRKRMDFSLFYFAADESSAGMEKYRLLLEGARFADEHGFAAVWTPERHFHGFGGLYPNPAVTSAAVAAVTKRVKIRAGSVVLPLHQSIRVAEEWAMVDNLSNGRAGVSFASGWQANDFVLAPEKYRKSKEIMIGEIEVVRRLWRGEELRYVNGKGEEIQVRIWPRPVQRELPIWLTAAGNPETFRLAGEMGANILTHLLGQTVEELSGKVRIYREAWQRQGHAGSGQVTLMLHTYVGTSTAEVRETVRGPFGEYLKSSVDLIKNAPKSFPTFAGRKMDKNSEGKWDNLKAEDLEALVAHAFDRYYASSALFGTVESCRGMVERLKGVGVDEIACLIDFGVETEKVLGGLRDLEQLKEWCDSSSGDVADDEEASISDNIREHGVTHFQCTPSMVRMILAEAGGREALSLLKMICVGGEALPQALAEELGQVVRGPIFNMYGPTETTVWSTVAEIGGPGEAVHIGRPIANTQVYILNERMGQVLIGTTGELYIGGLGVARGYWKRPELTAERFVADRFSGGLGKLYRTGDLARFREDGTLEYLGRLDQQVKIRGHRIELQEIESVLEQHSAVRQAIVSAREDGSGRLAAYLVMRGAERPGVQEFRTYLEEKVPDFMVPEAFVFLDALPLTPNGKVNRRALPAPEAGRPELSEAYVKPRTSVEVELAGIWAKELGLERVGVNDNFFHVGGNSLLAVQIAFQIRKEFRVELPLRSFFEHPTVAGLAREVEERVVEQEDESALAAMLSEVEGLGGADLGRVESRSDNEVIGTR